MGRWKEVDGLVGKLLREFLPRLTFESIKVCIPPEEEAFASKASGNKYKYLQDCL